MMIETSARLLPTTAVPMQFAAALETLHVPVRTDARVSGIVSRAAYTIGESRGGYAWYVPLVCAEFLASYEAGGLSHDGIRITYVTMCSLAAEAYAAEKAADDERIAASRRKLTMDTMGGYYHTKDR